MEEAELVDQQQVEPKKQGKGPYVPKLKLSGEPLFFQGDDTSRVLEIDPDSDGYCQVLVEDLDGVEFYVVEGPDLARGEVHHLHYIE